MAEEKHWQEGMKTHENIIFSCFGGLSNTGITSALASLEAVKELGLDKGGYRLPRSIATQCSPCFRKDRGSEKSRHCRWLPV